MLTSRRQERQYTTNIADKTHIEHSVGFIQNQNLHLTQIGGSLIEVIQQSPRRRHQNIDTLS